MDNFRDILSGDCFRLKNYTLNGIDKFGDMLHFQIRRKDMYTTKVGGCVTLTFLLIVFTTFAYYLSKFLDKSKPQTASDTFLDTKFLDVDIGKEKMKYFFFPVNMTKGSLMSFNDFWENFSFYAVNFKVGEAETNVFKVPRVSWTTVPFKRCKGQKWVESVNPESEKQDIEKWGICFDEEVPIPIYGGESFDRSSKLMVHLFTCQTNEHRTCLPRDQRQGHSQLQILMKVYEPNIRTDHYEDPITMGARFIFQLRPQNILKFLDKIYLKKTVLETDTGSFIESLEVEEITTQSYIDRTTAEQSLANLMPNIADLGAYFLDDWHWQVQLISSNTVQHTSRTYFTQLDAFSAVGGLMEFAVVAVFLLYNNYNVYKLTRHIVLKVVIGKEALFGPDYMLKKDFCILYFKEFLLSCRCCCFCCVSKKRFDTPELESKSRTLEAANEIVAEKMDIKNFIGDCIDFQAMRNLMLKSRHRFLMPLLVLEFYKRKKKSNKGYDTSFARNFHERTDMPVFDVCDAVSQIKKPDPNKSEVEVSVDEWFINNLPMHILNADLESEGGTPEQLLQVNHNTIGWRNHKVHDPRQTITHTINKLKGKDTGMRMSPPVGSLEMNIPKTSSQRQMPGGFKRAGQFRYNTQKEDKTLKKSSMTKKIQRQSLLKNASKFSKTETEVTNPRQTARIFRRMVSENKSVRDHSEGKNPSLAGIKMSESGRHFESKVSLSDDPSRPRVTSNKMSLFSIKSKVIIEEKEDMEQPEEDNREELRVSMPSCDNIESLQAPPQKEQPPRVPDCSPKMGQPPRQFSHSDQFWSELTLDQLEEQNLYRDKIMKELRQNSPKMKAFEPTPPLNHRGTSLFTMGSLVEGISPSKPNLFGDGNPRFCTPVTQVARHSPDSSVSGEIEVSGSEGPEQPTEKETPCSDHSILEVTGTMKKD